jgi:hypothetical protein
MGSDSFNIAVYLSVSKYNQLYLKNILSQEPYINGPQSFDRKSYMAF